MLEIDSTAVFTARRLRSTWRMKYFDARKPSASGGNSQSADAACAAVKRPTSASVTSDSAAPSARKAPSVARTFGPGMF